MEKFGVLLNNTYNIGDDLQSIASMHFLPKVDYFPFKEQLSTFKTENGDKAKTILNSWYMWKWKNFPPSDDIDPLCISMHFAEDCRKNILTKKAKRWFMQHGPVGCRDMDTRDWLLANGIDAYFSGCLTLTLNENPKLRENPIWGGYILCVNVSNEIVETVKKRTKRPVYVIGKNLVSSFYAQDRLDISKMYLYLYHQAAAVVTGNMHASMPSLAVNTPVCLLTDENKGPDVCKRFSGLIDFFNHYTTEEFLDNDVYNFDNPPKNPMKHLECRQALIERCKTFTGYYNDGPTLDDNFNPAMEMMKLLQFCSLEYDKEYKGMVATSRFRILKAVILRFLGKDKHDLIRY